MTAAARPCSGTMIAQVPTRITGQSPGIRHILHSAVMRKALARPVAMHCFTVLQSSNLIIWCQRVNLWHLFTLSQELFFTFSLVCLFRPVEYYLNPHTVFSRLPSPSYSCKCASISCFLFSFFINGSATFFPSSLSNRWAIC